MTGQATGPVTVDLHDAQLWQDPYPVWRRAMDQHRTARTPRGEVILLRADDVDVAVTDPAFVQLGVGALEMLGITDGPFYEWRRLTMAATDGADHERKRSLAARAFTPRRVERLRHPAEDLVSDLLDAEQAGRVNRAELVALVVNVIGGAVGSSRVGIANAILLLLRHPEQARWVQQDPERMRPAIEECLRYHPPFRAGRRRATVPVDRFGVHLEPGDTVYLARQAANRDPDRWSEPDTFDVTRPESRHYSFGYGPHFCLGQALARLDIQEAVSRFLQQCPDARLLDRGARTRSVHP